LKTKVNIAILASGAGSNADVICQHFAGNPSIGVALIISNKADAGVLQVARKHHVQSLVIENPALESELLSALKSNSIHFVVLAGFLRKIPDAVVATYPGRMVNIHPALLPDFGGKGMYGHRVHQAVIDAGKAESGITIHYVNNAYDEGGIIFQARCAVSPDDTADSLAGKIHELEHRYFPVVIEQLINQTQFNA